MNIYERYKKLIEDKKASGDLTPEFISDTTDKLDFYLGRRKITQDQYDELITLMNENKK